MPLFEVGGARGQQPARLVGRHSAHLCILGQVSHSYIPEDDFARVGRARGEIQPAFGRAQRDGDARRQRDAADPAGVGVNSCGQVDRENRQRMARGGALAHDGGGAPDQIRQGAGDVALQAEAEQRVDYGIRVPHEPCQRRAVRVVRRIEQTRPRPGRGLPGGIGRGRAPPAIRADPRAALAQIRGGPEPVAPVVARAHEDHDARRPVGSGGQPLGHDGRDAPGGAVHEHGAGLAALGGARFDGAHLGGGDQRRGGRRHLSGPARPGAAGRPRRRRRRWPRRDRA